MKSPRVLILDDESTLRTALFRLLDRKSFQVVTAQRIDEARTFLSPERTFDLAIIDMNLPDGNGLDFMAELKANSPNTQVIVLTGFATIDSAVLATQKGAFHFLTKPFNVEELMSLVDKALAIKSLEQENRQLRNELGTKYQFEQIIGESDGLKQCLSLVERVAHTDSTVLITGESGTGKELIARAIHYNSPRAKNPFIAINCGAIPSELLESELFGHVRGSFTGAIANRIGRFEMADEGTLFLDEIGDLEPNLQVKILRALQERAFEPVGSTKSVQVNVRVIAATNLDLEKAVLNGRFREDLFYRLNVIPIQLPALRERKTDIPILLNHFMNQFNKNKTRVLTGFTQESLNCLSHYAWPGNIRELENLIERLSILKGQGTVELNDLPPKYRSSVASYAETGTIQIPEAGLDFNSAVDQFENALIMKALEKTGWNKNQAAILLRLNRTTLVEKMKKKGLKSNDSEAEM
ncbi:MAG: sigma-54-dependent Fis family transcriptional regulator [Bdellovibrio sp.]|nr:sigma-54-dependent Fis family transcriptional regulator [Bdellovibrio sp.]